jgi:NAD(P)-dependent dehydrogenase (short-subunit alcohol dehydrogenase family)
MRILIIGASGTIGRRICDELSKKHEIIKASRSGADVEVDITSAESIEAMFKKIENIDHCICAAGPAKFAALDVITEEDFYVGIRGKMMGQINLVRIGQKYLNDGGAFTLTTGILADDPIKGGAAISMVNGAVNSFALAAAQELPRGLRINVVCPNVVEDSVEFYGDVFAGFNAASMNRVVNGYVRSVEGLITGRIIKIY